MRPRSSAEPRTSCAAGRAVADAGPRLQLRGRRCGTKGLPFGAFLRYRTKSHRFGAAAEPPFDSSQPTAPAAAGRDAAEERRRGACGVLLAHPDAGGQFPAPAARVRRRDRRVPMGDARGARRAPHPWFAGPLGGTHHCAVIRQQSARGLHARGAGAPGDYFGMAEVGRPRAIRCPRRRPVRAPAARGPSPRPPACGWGCAPRGRRRIDDLQGQGWRVGHHFPSGA
jgi:hypothetical protein